MSAISSQKLKFFLAIVSVASFFVFFSSVFAQDFRVSFAPQNPSPGEEVTARLSSFQFDSDRSDIIWEVDGTIIKRGAGERTVTFNAPDLGKTTNIRIYVTTNGSDQIVKDFVLVGNDIDMLWEAQTYTPYWYKGKALPVNQSTVKVTAIPRLFSDGTELAKEGLIYEWKVNYRKDFFYSGAENDFLIFDMDEREDYSISLTVSSPDGQVSTEKGIFIPASNKPKIVFYKNNPLEGIDFGRSLLNNMTLESSDIGIRAEPFFFSLGDGVLGDITYGWEMNNNSIVPDGSNSNILNLRTSNGGEGRANIELTIQNVVNYMQRASQRLRINF